MGGFWKRIGVAWKRIGPAWGRARPAWIRTWIGGIDWRALGSGVQFLS